MNHNPRASAPGPIVDPAARIRTGERRAIRAALAAELAQYEAHKRRTLVELNEWVARWCRDHAVLLDDLDDRGSPRPDRCTPEALSEWGDTLMKLAVRLDRAWVAHHEAVTDLRGKLEARREGAASIEGMLPWAPDGTAVSMGMRHALTMLPRLEPVHPA